MLARRRVTPVLALLSLLFIAVPLFGQGTGAIHGTVTATDGSALPGVTVEARSNVLPQPRVTLTDSNGQYRLPALVPGLYTLDFSLAGMQSAQRKAQVQLGQDILADAQLGVAGVSEQITVTAQATLVDRESTELQTGLTNEQIVALPITQEYRDLQKLVPGVMVSNDEFRGPSAGASGQDNVYLFDGVNVTMPLFGILNAEPSTHDIAQVNVVKGGAKAVDFDRAGGLLIDSVSKSGTNEFMGEVKYQVLNNSFIADQDRSTNQVYLEDRDWLTANLGGPVLPDQLYFYASYYRPTKERSNQANLYGELPSFESERNEGFGKLTWTPTQSWLVNGSYRHSKREDTSGDNFGTRFAGTTGSGSRTKLEIGTLEVSTVINSRSYATAKFTDYRNPGTITADNIADIEISTAIGTQLPIDRLDQIGRLTVPTPGTNAAVNAFIQPFINKYGYIQNGVRTGGGRVGFGPFANDDDSFYRRSGQIGYNITLGTNTTHDLHFGYQRYRDSEDRFQVSNGWGILTIPGGSENCPAAACGTATPAFFKAEVSQQGARNVPTIHAEFHSQAIEINDTIKWNNWSFNVGVLASNDTLYGQGLRKADNIAGFVASPGTKYEMFEVPWEKLIQPRLGATWAYNGSDTVYGSYARYNPAANSDARAASWDRNLATTINAYFDASGRLIGIDPVAYSSGKLFVADIDPPYINEWMIGTGQQFTNRWSSRLYGRYREGGSFWEDVNNNARVCFRTPTSGPQIGECTSATVPSDAPGGVARRPYIADLPARIAAIGSGSSYVIASLDEAFTKYYELTMEHDYNAGPVFVKGSYTWSHYYGNFDQDNSTVVNDAAVFIGSSFIADGAGRQLWNNRYGDLRGDRRHMFKMYGAYQTPWRGSLGAFFNYQSGQPYELWGHHYANPVLTGSTSDTSRYLEPAGTRRTPHHYQLDLNYTQNIGLPRGMNMQLIVDLWNALNRQTGYNYENRLGTLGACNTSACVQTPISDFPLVNAPFARNFYGPRRYQLALRFQF